MEENLRRVLLLGEGDWSTFLTRPISAALLVASLLLLAVVVLPTVRKTRDQGLCRD